MDQLKLRTVIADDEGLAREKLQLLLGHEPDMTVVAECGTVRETVAAIQQHRPDLLLLDIQMPDGSGFDVFKMLAPDEAPLVVFTTAYDQYAVQAFEVHALDYLLKPFDQERLHNCIELARLEIVRSRTAGAGGRGQGPSESSSVGKTEDGRLMLRLGGRMVFLSPNEVHWIEAASNYVRIYTANGSYLVRDAIGRLSQHLGSRFVRIHRSFIINVSAMREFQPCSNGEFVIVMKNGRELPGSRSYRPAVLAFLDVQSSLGQKRHP